MINNLLDLEKRIGTKIRLNRDIKYVLNQMEDLRAELESVDALPEVREFLSRFSFFEHQLLQRVSNEQSR
jgi:hypothetical protein